MAEALAFEQVSAGYGEAVVLDRLSFDLPQGQSLAILGRNGVGKTTLLETLMGNTRVSHGRIRWQGGDITRLATPRRVQAGLGWVPQETFASGLRKTVLWYLENLDWCRRVQDGSYQGQRLGTL